MNHSGGESVQACNRPAGLCLDRAGLELAMRPLRSESDAPEGGLYLDDAVLSLGKREHLFSSWVCLGRTDHVLALRAGCVPSTPGAPAS